MNQLVISFATTRFDLLKEHWRIRKNEKHFEITERDEKPKWTGNGLVAIYSLERKKILRKVEQENPMGIVQRGKSLFITDATENCLKIYDAKSLKLLGDIKNEYFNDLHSITLTKDDNFLITSSGLDLIIMITPEGKKLFEWWAFEHGYNKNPLGEFVKYNKSTNYSDLRIPTIKQATHLNYALEVNDNFVLVSFFHQGTIFSLSVKNQSTHLVFKGMKKPHTIRFIKGKYYIADSKNGRILELNENFSLEREFNFKKSWIQDMHEFRMHKNDFLLIADADKSKIYLFDIKKMKIEDVYSFDKNWRIGGIFPLNN